MADQNITPSDAEWFLDSRTTLFFCAGAAVSDTKFATTARLEGPSHDEFENANRYFQYVAGKWSAIDIDDNIISMIPYDEPGLPVDDTLAMLSAEGNVYIVSGKDRGRKERIPGAGVFSDDAGDFGYMNRIRQIGKHLYACGMGGKLYHRIAKDGANWAPLRTDIRAERPKYLKGVTSDVDIDIEDVIPMSDGALFVCGGWRFKASPAKGVLLYSAPGGLPWTQIPLDADTSPLKAMLLDGQTLYVCGGEVVIQFDLANKEANYNFLAQRANFESLAKYNGRIYAAGSQNFAVLTPSGLKPIHISKDNGVSCRNLQVVGNTMWIFGYKGVAKFDGNEVSRVEFPPVHR